MLYHYVHDHDVVRCLIHVVGDDSDRDGDNSTCLEKLAVAFFGRIFQILLTPPVVNGGKSGRAISHFGCRG